MLGDAKSQYDLGMCYFRGNGLAQDSTQAVAWFSKSAEQGFEPAAHLLARELHTQPKVSPSVPICESAVAAKDSKYGLHSSSSFVSRSGKNCPVLKCATQNKLGERADLLIFCQERRVCHIFVVLDGAGSQQNMQPHAQTV